MDWEWVKREIIENFSEFEELYHESVDDAVEKGFLVCVEIEEEKIKGISTGKKCSGTKCEVAIEDCKGIGYPLGSYHTHLPQLFKRRLKPAKPSAQPVPFADINTEDILYGIINKQQVLCVGDPRGLVCYTINKNSQIVKELDAELEPLRRPQEGKPTPLVFPPSKQKSIVAAFGIHPKSLEWVSKIAENIFDVLDPLLLKQWEKKER